MTVSYDPEYLKKLAEVADKNDKAGDWVTPILPDGTIVEDDKPVRNLLGRIGATRLTPKK